MKLKLRLRPPEHSSYGASTVTKISDAMDCLAHKELFLEKWLFRMRR
ncbi:hypothetical protein [uncultured Brevibacillus sp.]|nr:hypothetical protein [uncultured Brevibacillus sp.]